MKILSKPFSKRRLSKRRIIVTISGIFVAVLLLLTFRIYKSYGGSSAQTLLRGDRLVVNRLKYGLRLSTPSRPDDLSSGSYLRLPGYATIADNDFIAYNVPYGDTVIAELSSTNYYSIVRSQAEDMQADDTDNHPFSYYENQARAEIRDKYTLVTYSIDERSKSVGRCIAVAGDTVKVSAAQVYINGKLLAPFKGLQSEYSIKVTNTDYFAKFVEAELNNRDMILVGENLYMAYLTEANAAFIKSLDCVEHIEKDVLDVGFNSDVFPHDTHFEWNQDNFGPLCIPKKGMTVYLDSANISLYHRIITAYEGNTLRMEDGEIYINNLKTNTYTFRMNYYWIMNDNRNSSLDSRFWGFLPEDHIIGGVVMVIYSFDDEKSFPKNIRWSRMFRMLDEE